MKESDLRVGMYFTNDGNGGIPVFDGLDGTGDIIMTVSPGQLIGQIVDIINGPDGTVLVFVSDAISNAIPFYEKLITFITPDSIEKAAGGVKFSSFSQDVSDAQVQQQQQAMGIAEANGVTIQNSIKKIVKSATDTIGLSIPWGLVGLVTAGYVVTHWKNFFKQTNIKR